MGTVWVPESRETTDQIWVMRQIIERAAEYNTPAHVCFIDLTKAYDSVNRDALIAVLRNYKVPSHLVNIITPTMVPGQDHQRSI